MGSLFVLMSGVGLLISYILGVFLRYDVCVWVFMILPILFAISSTTLKETPFILLKKNKIKVGKKFSTRAKYSSNFELFSGSQRFSDVLSRS